MNFRQILAVGGALALGVIGQTAQAAPGFPMICRGGGNMMVTATMKDNGIAEVEVRFQRAQASGRVRAPTAGTCTWQDRVINAHEPTRMVYRAIQVPEMATVCSRGVCEVRSNVGQITELFGLATANVPFVVNVTNNPGGYFHVTQVGR